MSKPELAQVMPVGIQAVVDLSDAYLLFAGDFMLGSAMKHLQN